MKNIILSSLPEFRRVNIIREKIVRNTYRDEDLILLFGFIKQNADKLDIYQTKMLCELMQYLYAVKREERLPIELLELVDSILMNHR